MNYPNPGAGEELVKALSTVEHDRVSRVPKTVTALFVLDVGAAHLLEALRAIKRGPREVLIAEHEAEMNGTVATEVVLQVAEPGFEGSGAVTFADVADAAQGAPLIVASKPLFDAEATLAVLSEAQAALQAQNLELVAARDQADQAAALQVALDEHAQALAVVRADLKDREDQLLAAQEQIVALSNPTDGAAAGASADGAEAAGDATATEQSKGAKGAAKKTATKAK